MRNKIAIVSFDGTILLLFLLICFNASNCIVKLVLGTKCAEKVWFLENACPRAFVCRWNMILRLCNMTRMLIGMAPQRMSESKNDTNEY